MAYTPTVWVTGDTITAEKLNKAEQGIADAGRIKIVPMKEDDAESSSLTWKEISDLVDAGCYIIFKVDLSFIGGGITFEPMTAIGIYNGTYFVQVISNTPQIGLSRLACDSENGYPKLVSQ